MAAGVPRRTLSLCPDCNREAVDAVINGDAAIADFRDKPGIIEAEILEEAGRILMRKACENTARSKTCFPIIPISSEGWRALLSVGISDASAMKEYTITARTASRRDEVRI